MKNEKPSLKEVFEKIKTGNFEELKKKIAAKKAALKEKEPNHKNEEESE